MATHSFMIDSAERLTHTHTQAVSGSERSMKHENTCKAMFFTEHPLDAEKEQKMTQASSEQHSNSLCAPSLAFLYSQRLGLHNRGGTISLLFLFVLSVLKKKTSMPMLV